MKGKKVLSKVVATLAVSGLLLAGCSSGDEGGAKKESSKDKV